MDYYIGVMSGTSLDSVDVALCQFGDHAVSIIATHAHAIPSALKQKALHFSETGTASIDALGELDILFGHLFADAINTLVRQSNVQASDITAIGCHGQTVRHQPDGPVPFSLQIGDANIIAQETGITTVADFRRADIAQGGQGAPLVPKFHHWLLGNQETTQIVANVGGIANVTVLPAEQTLGPVLGFDTGPGNGLIDAWAHAQWDVAYDSDGALAAKGSVIPRLLEAALADPYFSRAAPKSTGKEYFNMKWLNSFGIDCSILAPEDVQATLVHLTVRSLASAVTPYLPSHLWVCGGGVHNGFLMSLLTQSLPGVQVASTATIDIDPDWLEATCFAWLARARLQGEPGNLPSVTGAKKAVVLGGLYGIRGRYDDKISDGF